MFKSQQKHKLGLEHCKQKGQRVLPNVPTMSLSIFSGEMGDLYVGVQDLCSWDKSSKNTLYHCIYFTGMEPYATNLKQDLISISQVMYNTGLSK